MLRVNFAIHLLGVFAAFLLAYGLARIKLPHQQQTWLWVGSHAAPYGA